MTEETKEEEKKPDFFHTTIYHVPCQVLQDFKEFAKKHTCSKYNDALSLLLELSHLSKTISLVADKVLEHEERLKCLEEKKAEQKGKLSYPKTFRPKEEVK